MAGRGRMKAIGCYGRPPFSLLRLLPPLKALVAVAATCRASLPAVAGLATWAWPRCGGRPNLLDCGWDGSLPDLLAHGGCWRSTKYGARGDGQDGGSGVSMGHRVHSLVAGSDSARARAAPAVVGARTSWLLAARSAATMVDAKAIGGGHRQPRRVAVLRERQSQFRLCVARLEGVADAVVLLLHAADASMPL